MERYCFMLGSARSALVQQNQTITIINVSKYLDILGAIFRRLGLVYTTSFLILCSLQYNYNNHITEV